MAFLLLLAALACGEATSPAQPTSEVSAPLPPSGDAPLPPESVGDLDRLTAVHLSLGRERFPLYQWSLTIGYGPNQTINILHTRQVEPSASRSVIQMSEPGVAQLSEALVVGQDGLLYMLWPDVGCVVQSGGLADGDLNPFASLLTLEPLTQEVVSAKLIGEVELANGFTADHYRIDQPDLSGDVYRQRESGAILALTAVSQAPIPQLGVAAPDGWQISYELRPNQGGDFGLPADCPNLRANEPYPLLADAADIYYADNTLLYRSGRSLADANAFYRAEMAAAGWLTNEEDNMMLATAVLLNYPRGGQTVVLSLSAGDDGLSVAIGP
jgi:hypothetical protein